MLDRARSIVLDVPYYHWPVLLILVVIPIIAGFTYWQFASAICCGALGGLLIMAGVGGLMLWQGRSLVSAMSIRQSFYLGIYLGVATIGALIQVLHAKIASLKDPNKVTKIKRKGRKKRGKEAETEEQKGGGIATWRTA
jgi:hypothetical protein